MTADTDIDAEEGETVLHELLGRQFPPPLEAREEHPQVSLQALLDRWVGGRGLRQQGRLWLRGSASAPCQLQPMAACDTCTGCCCCRRRLARAPA